MYGFLNDVVQVVRLGKALFVEEHLLKIKISTIKLFMKKKTVLCVVQTKSHQFFLSFQKLYKKADVD